MGEIIILSLFVRYIYNFKEKRKKIKGEKRWGEANESLLPSSRVQIYHVIRVPYQSNIPGWTIHSYLECWHKNKEQCRYMHCCFQYILCIFFLQKKKENTDNISALEKKKKLIWALAPSTVIGSEYNTGICRILYQGLGENIFFIRWSFLVHTATYISAPEEFSHYILTYT